MWHIIQPVIIWLVRRLNCSWTTKRFLRSLEVSFGGERLYVTDTPPLAAHQPGGRGRRLHLFYK